MIIMMLIVTGLGIFGTIVGIDGTYLTGALIIDIVIAIYFLIKFIREGKKDGTETGS
jgi:hypothetical protein